jgi:hypothetical protein
VARTRTTKKLAQRIDLDYFKRPTPLKRVRFWLSIALPLLAIAWVAWHGLARDQRVFSSGRMSAAHAVLEKECAACHVKQAGAFSAKTQNRACLDCHDGPMHHANQTFTPECATCHTEHRGRVNLRAASDKTCAECHSDLKTRNGAPNFAAAISTFGNDHPEFAALKRGAHDFGSIKLNHAVHLKAIRLGPTGPLVQLECNDCHRPSGALEHWRYGDEKSNRELIPIIRDDPNVAPLRRAFMAAPKFAAACSGCHLLDFDKRLSEGVPHDKPEIVHAFVVRKFTEYIAAHPAELRVAKEPDRTLTGRPIPPSVRVLAPAQWVQEKTATAEDLLWRKTCKQCHALTFAQGTPLPQVAASNISTRWMPHAKFDHDAHPGFSCVNCHAQAMQSTETSDILLPGIATCRTCHSPGPNHAESRCYECHTYHDWSKRKEVTPKFTLPALRTGGR